MQYDTPTSLPQPDALSAAHSATVVAHIRHKIAAAGGAISFAEYMHEALYAPGLGYYSAGAHKFGERGDFVTAPEVSAVFGRVLARQCMEVLAGLDQGCVLEIGAGSGKLAVDLLRAMQAAGALPSEYLILDVSPELQQRQQQRIRDELPQLLPRVRWLDSLPKNFTGVIIANEVLDALPVERFIQQQGTVTLGTVTQVTVPKVTVPVEAGSFAWGEVDAPQRLRKAVVAIQDSVGEQFATGFQSEVCLAMGPWLADVAESLHHGAMFLFDYGVSRREYYAVDRSDGWLRCHFRHHAHSNPLIHAGIQDITCWVDFTAVAEAAVAAELDILGYQTQAQFLIGGGLEAELQDFVNLDTEQQLRLSSEVKMLTLPGEMGESFKCMGLGRGEIALPSAFQFADRTQSL